MNVLYLNNSGHRWILKDPNGKKPKIFLYHKKSDGEELVIVRTAIEFQAFGNFASAVYYYKGKKYKTLNYKFIDQ